MSLSSEYLQTLNHIQERVLWLSMRIVHEANSVRPQRDSVKVGGHQASSSSMVTIMTALYFHLLKHGDRVSVKPHASPVFHAIQYLLGQLPRDYLATLRAFGGLQAYPSRTKDPDPVDFSTGSVGLGAVAPAFAALTHHYAQIHFEDVTSNRFIAIIGDAELDEGNIWEAIFADWMAELANNIWIVDLNRQSLDRVIPGIRAGTLMSMFDSWGWQVLEAKYGRKLQSLFAQKHGERVRKRIDDMSNEEYQLLVRLPGDELRRRFVTVNGHKDTYLEGLLAPISNEELPGVVGNLGGHDLSEMISVLEEADATADRPTVIFAYTIKGWRLPTAGDPHNHSKLLSVDEMSALAEELAVPGDDEWAAFDPESEAGRAMHKDRPPALPCPFACAGRLTPRAREEWEGGAATHRSFRTGRSRKCAGPYPWHAQYTAVIWPDPGQHEPRSEARAPARHHFARCFHLHQPVGLDRQTGRLFLYRRGDLRTGGESGPELALRPQVASTSSWVFRR